MNIKWFSEVIFKWGFMHNLDKKLCKQAATHNRGMILLGV